MRSCFSDLVSSWNISLLIAYDTNFLLKRVNSPTLVVHHRHVLLCSLRRSVRTTRTKCRRTLQPPASTSLSVSIKLSCHRTWEATHTREATCSSTTPCQSRPYSCDRRWKGGCKRVRLNTSLKFLFIFLLMSHAYHLKQLEQLFMF